MTLLLMKTTIQVFCDNYQPTPNKKCNKEHGNGIFFSCSPHKLHTTCPSDAWSWHCGVSELQNKAHFSSRELVGECEWPVS